MKVKYLLLAIAWSWPLAGARAEMKIFSGPLSPRIANYEIEVRLDAKERMLSGKETLIWRNAADQPVSELQFHLYLNAFRNTNSSWVREAGAGDIAKELKKDGWGFIEVDRLALATGEDLTKSMEFIHPDDDNRDDKTVLRIPLPAPVAPGQTVVVSLDFTARLPEPVVARTGCKKEFCFAGQWFPKIGVFENGSWNCHQFHANTEFYADFGVYDVRITVPEKNVVGATGLLAERRDNGDGTATHWYHAEDVHDFAWTTSPNFVEVTGREQDVEIRVLMHREHAAQAERHLEAARAAVRYHQDWYGDYPYPNLTVIDPKKGASGAGGMEYPTLITAGTVVGMPSGIHMVEIVIVHEFGHNFWYGLVASNEFEEAWLDEGINTYSEIKIFHDLYGAETSAFDLPGLAGDDLNVRRYGYFSHPDMDPIVRKSWEYYSRGSYGANAYDKPAMMLLTLDHYLGEDKMRLILRTYFERFCFKHPHTADFIAVASEVAGQDLSWFFDQALFDKSVLDYAVSEVRAEEKKPGKGYDYTIGAPEGDKLEPEDGDTEKIFVNKVRVRRLGDFRFPVTVEAEFADGTTVREQWDGQDAWIEYKYEGPVKLAQATVDPDGKVPLDLNWKNNRLKVRKVKAPGGIHGGYLEMIKFVLDPK